MAGKTLWDLSRTKPAAIPNAIAAKMILSQLSSARHLAGYLEATPDRQQKLHIKLPNNYWIGKKPSTAAILNRGADGEIWED